MNEEKEGDKLAPGESVFDISFVALVPTESQGQVGFQGNRVELIEALENYLLSLYGPKRYKIVKVQEADFVGDHIIHLPPTPVMSKEEH